MFQPQQVTAPVAPAQYGVMQVSSPSAYYPMQTSDDTTSMFSAMMPMIMMVMMFAILGPMLKGVTASVKE